MATWTKLIYSGGPGGTPSALTLTNATGLPAAGGGTGQDGGYAVGDILYASGATALTKLAAGADGYVLTAGGSTTAPAWEAATGSNQTLTTGDGISGADSGDSGDFTISATAAQTTLTSIYNAGLKIGYGSGDAYIDFSTDNQVSHTINGTSVATMKAGSISPGTDDTVDLGITSKQFKDGYFHGTVYMDGFDLNGTGVTSTGTELNLLDGSQAQTVVNSKAAIYGSSGQLAFTSLVYGGSAITSTAAELNILDGVTSTAAELNCLDGFDGDVDDLKFAKDLQDTGVTALEFDLLDGATAETVVNSKAVIYGDAGEVVMTKLVIGATTVTASPTELNIIDGVTATTAELNILDGVSSTAAELNILDGVSATAAEINLLDGVTSTTAELNILDGVSATAAEINILDGVTSTAAELNFLDGSTAGTAVASKALVVDSNLDIGTIRNLSITGDLSVTGSSVVKNTTVETVNIEDQQIKLASGASAASDCLIVADRGGANALSEGIVSTNELDAALYYDASTGHWAVAEVVANFNEEDTTPDIVSANISNLSLCTASAASNNGVLSPIGSIHIDTDDSNAVYVRRS